MLLFALLPANSALYAPAVATFPGQAAEGLWTETCSQPASSAVFDKLWMWLERKLPVSEEECGRVRRCCCGFIGNILLI